MFLPCQACLPYLPAVYRTEDQRILLQTLTSLPQEQVEWGRKARKTEIFPLRQRSALQNRFPPVNTNNTLVVVLYRGQEVVGGE